LVDLVSVLLTIIGTLVPVLISLLTLAYWLGVKFASIDERFKRIDERFKSIDERFNWIDRRFEEFKVYVDRRFDELKAYVDGKFNELKSYVDSRVSRLAEANRAYQEFFVEYLAVRGLLGSSEASMIKGESSRMFKLATVNPITREEWEKARRYFEKDELTLEEALEFREITRKITDEYGHLPEAWKLHLYASIMVGLALRKKLEEEKRLQGDQRRS